jgi:hypothetical protein
MNANPEHSLTTKFDTCSRCYVLLTQQHASATLLLIKLIKVFKNQLSKVTKIRTQINGIEKSE